MSKKFSPEELLGRWEDQREIKNLMGRLSQDYTLKEERSMYEKYWSKREDVCLGINSGWFTGPENVAAYYADEDKRICLESRLIAKAFPKNLDGKTEEELHGVGMMTYRPVDTPVIELSEDGKTAKGLWSIRGSYSILTEGGPQGIWEWGWFALDFIREEEEWKIWHMQYLKEIDRPCGSKWTGPKKEYEALAEFAEIKTYEPLKPNLPRTLRQTWSPERQFTPSPRMPEAYDCFENTFSYGI